MTSNLPAYGPLPTSGGTVGFIGIRAQGREGARENTGNFLHGYAARHILGSYSDAVTGDLGEADVERIRASFTHLAVVVATTIAVNREGGSKHDHLASIIQRLGLPVVVFGLGAQASLRQTVKEAVVAPSTLHLLRVLSDHSPSIAVRGEFTADLCQHLGIRNVEVIGCQSCFLSCRPDFRFPALSGVPELARSIVNFTRPSQELPLLQASLAAGATVIGQSSHFEYELKRHPPVESTEDLPEETCALISAGMQGLLRKGHLSLPAYQDWIKARFHQFYRMEDWFAFLSQGFDFTIGTRFHGNMTSVQAGIPALWVVHDMRTREFCDLMGLPNVRLPEVQAGKPLAQLVEENFDTSAFHRRYPENYARFHAYLTRHGVAHRLAPPVTVAAE
ncbi:hypothetical protein C0V75_17775 [Tabrizicola sp. TH137]|uniref:polysaccharide pyruvyl transferase family protein n=1 Tax=Tabrizicola sp. TH137 TaxID=2067452 RepID=UPI000C7DA42F|nr:polysaccharide pyruvyl transferase family protein [Tabrizicola sp. TH137]PLL11134.1 hypothetical protein C0V75_17775 [Tabrizicola sp. TH137]